MTDREGKRNKKSGEETYLKPVTYPETLTEGLGSLSLLDIVNLNKTYWILVTELGREELHVFQLQTDR